MDIIDKHNIIKKMSAVVVANDFLIRIHKTINKLYAYIIHILKTFPHKI